jgi:succinate dehydrogenase/fumarate reductase cytochrome b subunit
MNAFQKFSLSASATAVSGMVYASTALAQDSFAGPEPDIPGTPGGADGAGDIRGIINDIIIAVLNFLALIAVVVVIIAGIRLIVSQGNDEEKDKAKKAIFYALAGLVIVLFARVIVGLVTNYLAGEVGQ